MAWYGDFNTFSDHEWFKYAAKTVTLARNYDVPSVLK
jgi:hypothetical protein